MSSINVRIQALRKEMEKHNFSAYVIPSGDAHQSEYVAEHWKSREWVSGFSGSAGIAVVTPNHAGIWTDSRYFLMAEEELASSEFILHKQTIPYAPEHLSWLAENLSKGDVIGIDGSVFSAGEVKQLSAHFSNMDIEINSEIDLISEIWKDRPAIPDNMVYEHPLMYAGHSRTEKLKKLRDKMQSAEVQRYFIAALDEIAWLLNLRGSDVDCNPVFVAYAMVSNSEVNLFVDRAKVPNELVNSLLGDSIYLHPYNSIRDFLFDLPGNERVYVTPSSINQKLYEALSGEVILEGESWVAQMKSIKQPAEVMNISKAMRKDGIALLKLFRWLENELKSKSVSEVEVAEKLAGFRKSMGNYVGESFDAIVGYAANGAIVHYHPMPDTCALIKNEGILLLDSGGQYFEGTTDITRTIALSPPSQEQKDDYTFVLKGHIALDSAHFPKGTNGMQLDVFARQFLWQNNRNYGHGTGHGVGYFLNVHEGPQGISPVYSGRTKIAFEPGHFVSNEPGLYRTGKYGIRIENLVLCVTDEQNEFGEFLKFETLTLFPIDTKLIEFKHLSKEDVDWLNNYHQKVFDALEGMCDDEERNWLKERCKAI